MKKIVLFSLIACLGFVNTGFAGSCEIRSLTATEDEEGDEYLYVSKGHQNSQNAFVCERKGNSKNCDNGVIVGVNGQHFVGDGTKKRMFGGDAFMLHECSAKGFLSNDIWVDAGFSSLKECGATGVSLKSNYKYFGKMGDRDVYCLNSKYGNGGGSTWCVRNDDQDMCWTKNCPDCDKKDCPEFSRHPKKRTKIPGTNKYYEVTDCVDTGMIDCYEKIQDGLNAYWNGLNCVPCKNGEVPDHKNAKCVKKITPNPTPKDNDCAKYKANPEAYACCKTTGATWNEKEKKCDCDGNFVWDYDDKAKTGACVAKDTPKTPSTECTDAECTVTIKQSIKCQNGNSFEQNRNYPVCKEVLDSLKLDCDGLKNKINTCSDLECIQRLVPQVREIKEAIAEVCNDESDVYVPTMPDNSAQIAAAKNTLTSFFRNAESNASVWRDKDGNFNTARLASDLTAGVVLGTVGGVVSGVVIKKKQVEKGFDALHCTVGGQTVADWGDVFNVGLRR